MHHLLWGCISYKVMHVFRLILVQWNDYAVIKNTINVYHCFGTFFYSIVDCTEDALYILSFFLYGFLHFKKFQHVLVFIASHSELVSIRSKEKVSTFGHLEVAQVTLLIASSLCCCLNEEAHSLCYYILKK